MAIKSTFFNAELVEGNYDRVYDADSLAERFRLFFTNGVFWNQSAALQVVAGGGLDLYVQTGAANIDGYCAVNDSAEQITLNTAPAIYPRIDAVCLRLDLNTREMKFVIVEGTPAVNPVRPAIKNTETEKDLCLAAVLVGAGVLSVYDSDITDTRLDNSVCGIVTQAVQSFDTSAMYKQFNDSLTRFLETNEQTFNAWFETVKEQLSTIEIGDIENRVVELETEKTRQSEYIYVLKGVNDNVLLSQKVNNFLSESTDDGAQLKISVQGDKFGVGSAVAYNGTEYFMVFGTTTVTNRRVVIDFSNCCKIQSINAYSIYANSNIDIYNLNFVTAGAIGINSAGVRLKRSQIKAVQFGISGNLVYAEDCKIEVTGMNGTCAGVNAGGSLVNCDVVAASESTTGLGTAAGAFGVRLPSGDYPLYVIGGSYRGYVKSTATTSEAIGIYVPSGITNPVINVSAARCPQRARGGYVQTAPIKINTGYGSVIGCACYSDPLVYSTTNVLKQGNAITNLPYGLE